MPDLEIKISTVADTTGAKAATAAVKETTAATGKTGEASKEAASGAAKLTEGMQDQAKKSSFLGLNHRGLHKVVHSLAEQFPIAGLAAKAMLNPVLFTFTAAIGIFAKAKESLEEWNKTLDEAGAKAAEHADHFTTLKDAQFAAAEAAAAWSRELARAKATEDDLSRAVQHAIDLIHQQQSAMDDVTKAKEDAAIVRIDRLEKEGKITSEQAAAAKAAEHERAEIERRRNKDQAEQREAAAHQAAAETAKRFQPGLDLAAGGALARANDPNRQRQMKELEDQVKLGQSSFEEEEKKLVAAEQARNDAAQNAKTYAGEMDSFFPVEAKKAQQAYEEQQRKTTAARLKRDRDRQDFESLTASKKADDEAAEEAKKKALENAGTYKTESRAYEDSNRLHQHNAALRTVQAGEQYLAQGSGEDEQTLAAMRAGQKVSGTARANLDAHLAALGTTEAAMMRTLDLHQSLAQLMRSYQTRIEALEKGLQSGNR